MDLKLADKIRLDWGKFLEISNGPLMMLFMSKIPQSLLPYPKEKIIEALDVITQHFAAIGNSEAVKTIESTKPLLEFYVDDQEAIQAAIKNFSNENYLKAILPKLPERQKDLLAEIELIVNNKNNL